MRCLKDEKKGGENLMEKTSSCDSRHLKALNTNY